MPEPDELPIRTDEPENMRAVRALMLAQDLGLISLRWAVNSRNPQELETLYRMLWPVAVDGVDDPDKVAQMRREIRWSLRVLEQGRGLLTNEERANVDESLYRELWPPTVDGTPNGPDSPQLVETMRRHLNEGRGVLPADGAVHYYFVVRTRRGENEPAVVPEAHVTPLLLGMGLRERRDLGDKLIYRRGLLPLPPTSP